MERKAITEEDVQTWKRRRLRGAKSAESLLVLPQSSSIDSTKRMSRLVDENMLMKMFQGKVKSSYCVSKQVIVCILKEMHTAMLLKSYQDFLILLNQELLG